MTTTHPSMTKMIAKFHEKGIERVAKCIHMCCKKPVGKSGFLCGPEQSPFGSDHEADGAFTLRRVYQQMFEAKSAKVGGSKSIVYRVETVGKTCIHPHCENPVWVKKDVPQISCYGCQFNPMLGWYFKKALATAEE